MFYTYPHSSFFSMFLSRARWQTIWFELNDEYSLRIIIGPKWKTHWHLVGPRDFKSVDLLSFAPKNTRVDVQPGRMVHSFVMMEVGEGGKNTIILKDFEDPVYAMWVLFHEIGHIWSYRTGKRPSKTQDQEERDAWAYSFRMLRKLSFVCGVQLLTKECRRDLLKEMSSLEWDKIPNRGKTTP
jgi:hypothetical protein